MNNKTNIEENIKTIKDFIEYYNSEDYDEYESVSGKEIQAIENILEDRAEWKNKAEWFKRLCNKNEEIAKQLQAKANAYDSLTENIKDMLKKEKEEVKHFANINDEVAKRHAYTANALEELLDTNNNLPFRRRKC